MGSKSKKEKNSMTYNIKVSSIAFNLNSYHYLPRRRQDFDACRSFGGSAAGGTDQEEEGEGQIARPIQRNEGRTEHHEKGEGKVGAEVN
jgi:hypothetical protein